MQSMTIVIDGQPVGKGRARAGKNGHYTPAKTRGWESAARLHIATMRAKHKWPENYAGPVEVSISALFAVPASDSKADRVRRLNGWHTQVPDADNVAKAVLDALNGIVLKDDSQVVGLNVSKRWWTDAGVSVTVQMVRVQDET